MKNGASIEIGTEPDEMLRGSTPDISDQEAETKLVEEIIEELFLVVNGKMTVFQLVKLGRQLQEMRKQPEASTTVQ